MEPKYWVFVRSWWKIQNGRRVPYCGPKTGLAHGMSYSAAVDYCRVYNLNHAEGTRGRKAEFTQESR